MKLRLFFALAAVFLFSGCDSGSKYIDIRAYYHDTLANRALKNNKTEVAQEQILSALETEPEAYQLHSNLGIVFDQLKKPDDAEKSFLEGLKNAEKNQGPEEAFKMNYNLGVLFQGQKKIEQALQYYQAALELNPTSKETKANIELMMQQNGQDQNKGKGDSENKDDPGKGENKDDKDSEGDQKKEEEKQQKDRKQTGKYKPRPYQGEQLTEGDVKKILGELSQQDQKIRSQFNKKDRKEDRNGKDW